MANRLRRRTSDQTVLGSNPAVAAALSPWTRLFTPIVPRRSLHISFYQLFGHPCKIYTSKKKIKITVREARNNIGLASPRAQSSQSTLKSIQLSSIKIHTHQPVNVAALQVFHPKLREASSVVVKTKIWCVGI